MKTILLKFIGSFMFKRVALFLAKAITDSSKNTVDDNVYDLIVGQINNDDRLKKKAIKNLVKNGADFVEDEIMEMLNK